MTNFLGVGMGTFHAGRVQRLAVELRITRVPRILAVMNGRVTEFRGQKSLHSLRQFVRELFPQKLIQSVRGFSCVFCNIHVFTVLIIYKVYQCNKQNNIL